MCVKVETILNEETSHHVHHWLMYECGSRYENEFLVNRTSPEPSVCTDGKGVWGEVRDSGLCSKISLGKISRVFNDKITACFLRQPQRVLQKEKHI